MELIWIALLAVQTVFTVAAVAKSADSESGGGSDAGAS